MDEKIFINYRREIDSAPAMLLHDRLARVFGEENVFLDVDGDMVGKDFVEELSAKVAECDVFIVVVGRGWADVRDKQGGRRLDNPNDWVRVEIESALAQGKMIIPVRIYEAELPTAAELPESLARLPRFDAPRLTHPSFNSDVARLAAAIGRRRAETRAAREAEQRKRQEEEAEASRRAEEEERRKAEEALRAQQEAIWLEAERKAAEDYYAAQMEAWRRAEEEPKALEKPKGIEDEAAAETRWPPAEIEETQPEVAPAQETSDFVADVAPSLQAAEQEILSVQGPLHSFNVAMAIAPVKILKPDEVVATMVESGDLAPDEQRRSISELRPSTRISVESYRELVHEPRHGVARGFSLKDNIGPISVAAVVVLLGFLALWVLSQLQGAPIALPVSDQPAATNAPDQPATIPVPGPAAANIAPDHPATAIPESTVKILASENGDGASATAQTQKMKAELWVASLTEPTKVDKVLSGNVVWRLENVDGGPGEPGGSAVRGDVDVPDAKLKVTLLFQKNYDTTLSASHTIKVTFKVAPGSDIKGVKMIAPLQMRRPDAQAGEKLQGVPVPITENNFLIGLMRGDREARNIYLMRSDMVIDLPMQLTDGRAATINIEKGALGVALFDQAAKSWDGAGHVSKGRLKFKQH